MRSSLGTLLLGLVRRELIRPERTATGRDAFRFSHALVRDAVYDQMPHKIRSDLHERYAVILSSEETQRRGRRSSAITSSGLTKNAP